MGKIRYEVDRVKNIEGVYEKYWNEVMLMDEANEKEVRMDNGTATIMLRVELQKILTQTFPRLARRARCTRRFPPPCSSLLSSAWVATTEWSSSKRSPRPSLLRWRVDSTLRTFSNWSSSIPSGRSGMAETGLPKMEAPSTTRAAPPTP